MNKAFLIALTIGTLAVACGDDTSSTGGGATGGSATGAGGSGAGNTGGNGAGNVGGTGGAGGGTVIPPKPELGAQIDRMGRPAINTALSGAFVTADMNGVHHSDDAVRDDLENTYNHDDQENNWGSNKDLFALNLGVLDSLDTGLGGITNAAACSNQPGSCLDSTSSAGGCYDLLGTVLADDRLWVDSEGMACSAAVPALPQEGYLAVELRALMIDNTGCGGRRPIDDVIETTYSAVAGVGIVGFDDGITAPAGLHPELFPYLAPPH